MVVARSQRRYIIRRVLVPLDETSLSAAILPDARRLAGPDGELILVYEIDLFRYWDASRAHDQRMAVEQSRDYVDVVAERLRAENVRVETRTVLGNNAARAIDDASTLFGADALAMASRAPIGPGGLPRRSTAWVALAHSTVPVLIRHIVEADVAHRPAEPSERRVMVPLDGSALAETALPLARELASEWKAALWLVHVVTEYPISGFAHTETNPDVVTDEMARESGQRYLDRVALELGVRAQTRVLTGSPVHELVAATRAWGITDVVLASHGRTGLQRVFLGSVTEGLLHQLQLPMIVVPALAVKGEAALSTVSRKIKTA